MIPGQQQNTPRFHGQQNGTPRFHGQQNSPRFPGPQQGTARFQGQNTPTLSGQQNMSRVQGPRSTSRFSAQQSSPGFSAQHGTPNSQAPRGPPSQSNMTPRMQTSPGNNQNRGCVIVPPRGSSLSQARQTLNANPRPGGPQNANRLQQPATPTTNVAQNRPSGAYTPSQSSRSGSDSSRQSFSGTGSSSGPQNSNRFNQPTMGVPLSSTPATHSGPQGAYTPNQMRPHTVPNIQGFNAGQSQNRPFGLNSSATNSPRMATPSHINVQSSVDTRPSPGGSKFTFKRPVSDQQSSVQPTSVNTGCGSVSQVPSTHTVNPSGSDHTASQPSRPSPAQPFRAMGTPTARPIMPPGGQPFRPRGPPPGQSVRPAGTRTTAGPSGQSAVRSSGARGTIDTADLWQDGDGKSTF